MFLHIGLPKTGTSFLQQTLRANEATLRQQGVCLPGRRGDHFWAALDACGLTARRSLRVDPERVRGAWPRLLEEARSWPGTVLFTNELFSGASGSAIARIVEDLSPAEVHVIVAVRDLARALPATWQQTLKAGDITPLGDYICGLRGSTPDGVRSPRVLFPNRMLAHWQQHLKPEHIHLITIPPKGSPRDVLWQRFSEILGVDPDSCTLPGTVNESLGPAEAELLWRVNVHLVPRLPQREISTWVRDELANGTLARRPRTKSLAVPEDARPWVLERSRAMAESLREAGYDVHGRLEELIPTAESFGAGPLGTVGAEETLDVATETIAELVMRLRHERRRARASRRRLRRLLARNRRRESRSLTRRLARILRHSR